MKSEDVNVWPAEYCVVHICSVVAACLRASFALANVLNIPARIIIDGALHMHLQRQAS